MLKRGYFIVTAGLFLGAPAVCAAQQAGASRNRITLSYTAQHYVNSASVFNDGIYPDAIAARNTYGYAGAVGYRHTAPSGVLYELNGLYGRQAHDVTLRFSSLGFFDPAHEAALKDIHKEKNYSANVGYVGLKGMVGYDYRLRASSVHIVAKAGATIRASVTPASVQELWSIAYEANDTLFISYFAANNVSYGNRFRLGDMDCSANADFYIGVRKDLPAPVIKDISLGCTLTYGIGKKYRGIGNVTTDIYSKTQGIISRDAYRSQDFSIGVCLGIGLWPERAAMPPGK